MFRESAPTFVCLDLEGVLFPEIWLAVGSRWPDPAFRLTTRDCPDYSELCRTRFSALRRLGVRWPELSDLICSLSPLPGAAAFLDDLRRSRQAAILTDSFSAFTELIAPKLGYPTILCHRLIVDVNGFLDSWEERVPDSKARAVRSFQALGYRVAAVGDGLNDLPMLAAADHPVLFRPSRRCAEAADQRGIPYRLAENYGEIIVQ